MANARSFAYLQQRMLERAEDAAAALRAAIGPTNTDLATLQQQQQHLGFGPGSNSGSNGGGAYNDHGDGEDDDDLQDGDDAGSRLKMASNPYLAGILTSLDSSSDDARIDGLRRIIAAIAAGRYRIAHAAFPAVLKLTSSSITSLHVRKLVSIILARSASAQPDLALLAVNSFQRDLSHHSPLIRASALRALGSLRIPVLAPILRLAIASAARDSHPHVRRLAALSLSKAHSLDTTAQSELVSILLLLLNDRSPSVLGAALIAYSALGSPSPELAGTASLSRAGSSSAPASSVYTYDDADDASTPAASARPTQTPSSDRQQYALLHPFYRKLCYALADMDEWAQTHALDVLLLYARANFTQPAPPVSSSSTGLSSSAMGESQPKGKNREREDIEAFFATDDDHEPSSTKAAQSTQTPVPAGIDEKAAARRNVDLELLLSKAQALLMSRSPAVVLAVVRLTYYLSPLPTASATTPVPNYTQTLIRPLLRYVRPSTASSTSQAPELAYLSILNLTYLITSHPSLLNALQPHIPHFLPRTASAEEPLYLSLAKVDILVELCRGNAVGAGWVLGELEWLARTADAAPGGPGLLPGGGDSGSQGEEGGRLARRAVEAIGQVVERVRLDLTAKTEGGVSAEADSKAEAEELSRRAMDILLRLIRGTSSGARAASSKKGGKASAGSKRASASTRLAESLQPGVVASAITVLSSMLQIRPTIPPGPSSHHPGPTIPDPGPIDKEPSNDELSTSRILSHFPVLLFGSSPSAPTGTTTTTTVNAQGKTVQLIRRPRVMGRGAIVDPAARAQLFWLLGQYSRTRVVVTSQKERGSKETVLMLAELVGPDLLRCAALNFGNEDASTKCQIITFAAKLGALLPSLAHAAGGADEVGRTTEALVGYVMQLGRYDADYDVRDRARFCKALARGLVLPSREFPTAAARVPAANGGIGDGDGQHGDGGAEQDGGDGDEEVGGVKLRREQVLMVLFEGKDLDPSSVETASSTDSAAEEEDTTFGTLALALSGPLALARRQFAGGSGKRKRAFLLRGWQRASVPAWASAETATPASVRDPPLQPQQAPTQPQASAVRFGRAVADAVPAVEAKAERAVEALASQAAAELRTSGPGAGAGTSTPSTAAGAAAAGVGAAAPLMHGGAGASSRYRDLEDFLDDDEDVEEVEIEVEDEDAPEDEEYRVEDDQEEDEEQEDGQNVWA